MAAIDRRRSGDEQGWRDSTLRPYGRTGGYGQCGDDDDQGCATRHSIQTDAQAGSGAVTKMGTLTDTGAALTATISVPRFSTAPD